MIHWTLETIPISSIKDHPKNPRQINKEAVYKLANLVDKFGLIDKPIVNVDYTLIGGHQRLKILRKKKVKQVECWIPNRQLDEKEVGELCIGLNLHQGRFDYDILANEWEPLDLLQWGFTEEQLLGTCKEAEEILGEEQEKSGAKKKKKECPACGHEF